MTSDYSATERPYLKPSGPLEPANAAVALIIDESDRYLVQLRDPIPTIFFPDHWGCFGGALEPGETDVAGLARELREELGLDITNLPTTMFTDFTFDFAFAGGGVIYRRFFEVIVPADQTGSLTLGEGREMRWFAGPDLLTRQVVPYDRFAIWMHHYREDLRRPTSHT